ncbi:response regulator transcription factor [Desulfuromonas carbonis]|uniref:response regulator transcription factor n=1 Tax=Desulfuromonas sp. DDH964 TaxID=1823759 RepID=UPI00078C120F|nr:response regulator transcription factor [Desulfuromonas sp. DDH964]AMV72954.1 winged-helix transcriptional response regulator [Desulfuromonas sp. DDH964]
MTKQANRILIIDDDVELCELLKEYLGPEGFVVESSQDGESGAERAIGEEFELVVLDIMLPGMSGLDVLRRIRQVSKIAVVMLTARGDEIDRIVGLELGADDYMPKPFNPRELVARIRAVQRRLRPAPEPHQVRRGQGVGLTVGDIFLDQRTLTAKQKGVPLELTAVEFALLAILLRNAGAVVTREDLVQSVLGRELSPYDRSIDVHISNLRRKLGPLSDGSDRIKTLRGTGYQYLVPEQKDIPEA